MSKLLLAIYFFETACALAAIMLTDWIQSWESWVKAVVLSFAFIAPPLVIYREEIWRWVVAFKRPQPVVLEGQSLGLGLSISPATLEVTPPSRWFRIRRFMIEASKYVYAKSPKSRFAALHDELAEELEKTESYQGFPMFAEEGSRWAKRETLAFRLTELGIEVPDSRDDEAWMDILPPLVAFSANRRLSDARNLRGSDTRGRILP